MSLPVYQNTIVNDRGDVMPEALLRVRTDPGQGNVVLYKDRDASDVLTNVGDVYADIDGFVRFYLPPGVYRMHVISSGYERTYRHVQVNPLNEYNVVSVDQYTLQVTDMGNNIQFISDNSVSVEIPTDEDIRLPMWSEITLIQAGDGAITLSGDVTIQNPSGGPVKSLGKGSSIKLTLIGGDIWLARVEFDRVIRGDIEQTGDLSVTGIVDVDGQFNIDNLRLDGNTISSTDTNGNVEITPHGTGKVRLNKDTDITGDASVSGDLDVVGDTVLHGGLRVKGTVTIIDSTEVDIGDNIIRLNANETGQPTLSAGFEVERGLQANVSFLWDEFNKRWTTGGQALDVSQLIVNGQALDGDDVAWIAAARTSLDFVDPSDGGLLVNNQKTGSGLERVLTESDLDGGGGGAGESYESVAAFIASTPSSSVVNIISYYGGWSGTVEGPTGGFTAHRTGYTADSPSVGNPVAPSTIGTGEQTGLYWTADGAEWGIEENLKYRASQFGVLPNGVDQRARLQSVINWLAANEGGVIELGQGVYTLSSGRLTIPAGNPVALVGAGKTATVLNFTGAPNLGDGTKDGHLEVVCDGGAVSNLSVNGGQDPTVSTVGLSGILFKAGTGQRCTNVLVKNVSSTGIMVGGGASEYESVNCEVENTSWGMMIGHVAGFNIVRPRIRNTVNDGVTMRFGAGPGQVVMGRVEDSGHSAFSVTNGADIDVIGCVAERVRRNDTGPDPIEAGFECESRDGTSQRVFFTNCHAIDCHTGFVFRERDGNSGILAFENAGVIGGSATGCTNGIVFKDSGKGGSVTGLHLSDCSTDIIWQKHVVPDVSWSGVVGDTTDISNNNTVFLPNGEMIAYRTVSVDLSVDGWHTFQYAVDFYNNDLVALSWNLVGGAVSNENLKSLANLFVGTLPGTNNWRVRTDGTGTGPVEIRVTMHGRYRAVS